MYFSKYGAYSVESGLFIIFTSFLCEFVLVRTLRLRNPYAPFKRRFHIGIEREALREIGVGLGRPAHPQPEQPAIGVALRATRVQFDGAGVVGDRAVEISPRKTQVSAVAVRGGVSRIEFDGAIEVRERPFVVFYGDARIPAVVIGRNVLFIALDGAIEIGDGPLIIAPTNFDEGAIVVSAREARVESDGDAVIGDGAIEISSRMPLTAPRKV